MNLHDGGLHLDADALFASLEQRLSGATAWKCPLCGEQYVVLRGGHPPTGACGRCVAAAAAAPPAIDVLLEQAGVPKLYRAGRDRAWWHTRFGADPAQIDGWRGESGGGSLVLYGPPGTGKTGLAAVLLAEALAKRPRLRALWLRVPTLAEALALGSAAQRASGAEAFRASSAAAELLWRAERAELLVLDELQTAKVAAAAPWILKRVYDLIATRYDECRATIATTNAKPTDIAADGESTASRVLRAATVVHLGGADRRGQ